MFSIGIIDKSEVTITYLNDIERSENRQYRNEFIDVTMIVVFRSGTTSRTFLLYFYYKHIMKYRTLKYVIA